MKITLALHLTQKPLVGSLISEEREYVTEAITDAINACRLHGHAQLLASMHLTTGENDASGHEFVKKDINRAVNKAQQDIQLMACADEEFEIKITEAQGELATATRIDIYLKKKDP